MSATLIANRYAKALIDLAAEANSIETVQTEIRLLQDLVRRNTDVARLVSAPLIAPSKKAKVFDDILATLTLSPLVRRFFTVVSQAARLNLLDPIAEAFHRLVDARMGVVEAHVTTPHPLTPTQIEALSLTLMRRTGKKVRLVPSLDPSLLGGLKVQVGSMVYDASLLGRLRQMRTSLLSV